MDFRQAFDPFRALGVSYRLLRRAPLTLLLGGFLLAVTDLANSAEFQGRFGWDQIGFGDRIRLTWISPVFCGLWILLFPIHSLLLVGYPGALQRVMVTGEQRFKDLFQDRGLWLSMVLARLMKLALVLLTLLPFYVLIGVPVFVAGRMDIGWLGVTAAVLFSLAYLPVWGYVMLGFLLVEGAVAIEGKRPIEAVQRSWQVAEGNRLRLLLYLLVMIGLEIVSSLILALVLLLTCCLGLPLVVILSFLPAIWIEAAWFESYLRFALPAPPEGNWVDRAV